jgi:tRNA(Ile)-lysidine synthase
MFVAKVKNFINANGLISRGETVLAAVSGGPDSVALLSALVELREDLDFSLSVVHVNHGLRPEAAEEERFVMTLCGTLGLECVVGKVDTLAFAAQSGCSVEESARELRHGFLMQQARVATDRRPRKVALGHTLDDQAETVLMRLIRGAGVRGLSAMKPVSAVKPSRAVMRVPGNSLPDVLLIRPLLSTTRQEVLEFLKSRRVTYVEDASNLELTFLRNRVRHELVGLLRDKYNPRIVQVLGSHAELLAQVEDYLVTAGREAYEQCVSLESAERIQLELPRLLAYHVCVQGYVLREAYLRLRGTLRDLGFSHVAFLVRLVSSGNSGDSVDLPHGVSAVLEGKELLLGPRSGLRPARAEAFGFSVHHEPGSRTWLSEFSLGVESRVFKKEDLKEVLSFPSEARGPVRGPSASARARADSSRNSAGALPPAKEQTEVFFDLDALSPPLVLRNLRPGDRIYPFGMKGSKKVQDLLVDMKVPRSARRRLVALCDDNEMLWLVGIRRGAAAPVRSETRLILAVRTYTAS